MTQYYTDFTEYTLDAQPSDWTERWHTTVASTIADDQPPLGGGMRSMKITNSDTDRYAISWDDVGTPSGDVEVLAKVARTVGGSDTMRVYLHGSGTDSTESAYFITFQATSVLLAKYVDGAVTQLGTTQTLTATNNAWYWVRLQRSSTTIRAKIWQEGEEEPASWNSNLTDTDSSLSSGWVGVGNNYTGGLMHYDWFSVGTSGDSAPEPGYTEVFHWLSSPVDITPSSGTWVQTDISSYVSELSTGVIVRAKSTASANNYVGGVRVYGSTPSYPGILHPGMKTQYIVGHNYGYVDLWYDSNIDYELMGYVERAVFVSPTALYYTANGWLDRDMSSQFPGSAECQAAIVMCVQRDTAGANHEVGWRKNGSTETRTSINGWSDSSQYGVQWGSFVVPTDTGSIWEAYADNSSNYTGFVYQGFIPDWIEGFTWNTPMTARTCSGTGSYENLTAAASNAKTAFYQVYASTEYDWNLRPDGGDDDLYTDCKRLGHWAVECGPGGIVEAKVSNTALTFYEFGYEESTSIDYTVELTDALTADTATITTPVVATTYWNTVTAEDAASASVSIESGIFVGNLYKVALEKKVGEGSWYEIQSYEYGEDQQYQDDDVTANTWYYYRAARYIDGAMAAYSNESSLFYNLPIEVPEAMGADASMNDVPQYFIVEGIEIERKTSIDGTYALVLSGSDDLGYWDDSGPFVKGTEYWYRARNFRDYGDEVSGWSDEQYIVWYGSIDVDLESPLIQYTAGAQPPLVYTSDTVTSEPMVATTDVFPPRLFFQSILGVPPMETVSAELTFYYAWGSGPSVTDHALVITAEAGVLEPVVIIPKVIDTTVVLAGEAVAGGAARLRTNTARPEELEAEARLAAGDDAHDVDGFVVTVHKTTYSTPYTMGTSTDEEYVHYVSPEKREFRIYGVPADDRYHLGVRAYRQVDTDVFTTYARTDDDYNVLYSDMAQYPASDQAPINPADVNYTGNIDGVGATTVASGAQQGATAYGVTSTAFDSGTLIASWKPSSVTAVPYSFDGLFGNQNYLGYVTRGASPASPVWHTYMDSDGNFYLGGSTGSNSGLAWDSDSNDLSINFDNASTGGITMNSIGYLRSGQTAYDTGTGFWLGYDSTAVKMSIGDGDEGITWDGSNLHVKGSITVTNPDDFESGSQNFNSTPTTPYRVGDTWTDTSGTTPKLWKCTTERLTGDFTATDWTISSVRVFTVQPTTPYAIGDVWLDTGTPPKTWKCTTARATGSFVAGDWTAAGDTTKDAIQQGTEITGGYIRMAAGGQIYSSGKTTYNSATAGFWLGYDSGAAKYRFGIGDSSKYLTWDGTTLTFSGSITGSSATFGGITLNSSGISSTYFNVSSTGVLTCTSGNFSGTLSGASISGTTGTIGGVTFNSGGISAGHFSVNSSGYMTCDNANVSGTITSSNANITGTITSNNASFCSGTVTVSSSQMKFRSGSIRFYNSTGTTELGYMTAIGSSLQLYGSNQNLYLTAGLTVIVSSSMNQGLQIGNTTYGDSLKFGTGGVTIYSGYGSPSGTPSYGTIYCSTGGSLWVYTTLGWGKVDFSTYI